MYSQMFDNVDIGLIAFAPNSRIFDWNRWMENRTGMSKIDVSGRSLFRVYPELKTPWFERNCRSVLKFGNYAFFSQKIHGYCIPIQRRYTVNRDFEYMQQNCTLGPLRDAAKTVNGLFLMVQDVTELAIYEKKLSELARIDGLTGIFNRSHLETRLAAEIERHRRYRRPMSIMLLDVDHFKAVNDVHGHLAGDEVLRQLALLIGNHLRSADLLARYGGEEFVVLLPETDAPSAAGVAEKLRALVECCGFEHDGEAISITTSAGVASLDAGTGTPDEILKAADTALYRAKELGRNRVEVDQSSSAGSSGVVSSSAAVSK